MSALDRLGPTAAMGPQLQIEVETQLLLDLRNYGIEGSNLKIDWSSACQEGHCTQALDGNLEELSSVAITDSRSVPVAEGWMDFIHGEEFTRYSGACVGKAAGRIQTPVRQVFGLRQSLVKGSTGCSVGSRAVMPNPSIERTSPSKPGAASHLKRWAS
jgi:hypothetical protein